MAHDDKTVADLEQALLNDATEGISTVAVDGLSVTSQSLDARLKVADRHKNKNAASLPHFGMRTTRLLSPGGGNS